MKTFQIIYQVNLKKFDSGDFDYTNQFSIYEINYEKWCGVSRYEIKKS